MRNLLIAAVCLILSACGGGGGSSPASSSPEASLAGVYTGSLSTGNDAFGIVLSSNKYYFVYGNEADGVTGFLQGTLSASDGHISSSNLRDFNLADQAVYSATVTGSYSAGSTMNGTADYGTTTATFSLAYDAADSITPTTAAIAGYYEGSADGTFGSSLAGVTLAADGSFTGQDNTGCNFSGHITPTKGGYTLSASFGGGSCYYPGQTLSGVLLVSGSTLYGALPDAARTGGIVFTLDPAAASSL